jgi:hypothetical protein
MTAQAWLRTAFVAGVLSMGSVVAAQPSVSPADIERLQDQVFQASSEVARVRATDA